MNTTPTAPLDALIKEARELASQFGKHYEFPTGPIPQLALDAYCLLPKLIAALTPPVTQAASVGAKELRDLIQTLIDNDPLDLAADGGVTVLDVWRQQAKAALLRPSDGWNRDMSKAPRDRSLLLKIGNHYDVGDWFDGGGRGWWVAHCVEVHPTAWFAFQFIAPPTPEAGHE